MSRQILMTPGPVAVPDWIWESIREPVIHHRSEAFHALWDRLSSGLQYLFQTRGQVLALNGSGTLALELSLQSLFRPGQRVLVCDLGKFSHRWAEFGEMRGWKMEAISAPWGKRPETEEILAAAKKGAAPAGLVLTHVETSTGVRTDVEEVAAAFRQQFPDALIVVDAVTSAGILPLYFDAWGIDAAVAASQKGLLNPAGTSFVALSERAVRQIEGPNRDDYFHLGPYLAFAQRKEYPFTPPTQLLYGIVAALEHISARSLPSLWNHTHQLAGEFRRFLREQGGEIKGLGNADSLTVFSFPGQDSRQLQAELQERGFTLSGGQGVWKGEVLRLAHFGPHGQAELRQLRKALEQILN